MYGSAERPDLRQQCQVCISSPPQAGAQLRAKQELNSSGSRRVTACLCGANVSFALRTATLPLMAGEPCPTCAICFGRANGMRRPCPLAWTSAGLITWHLPELPPTKERPAAGAHAHPEPAQAPAQADRLGMCCCPEKQRGEVGGLHSNRALGDTEMDLHGNNKSSEGEIKETSSRN